MAGKKLKDGEKVEFSGVIKLPKQNPDTQPRKTNFLIMQVLISDAIAYDNNGMIDVSIMILEQLKKEVDKYIQCNKK